MTATLIQHELDRIHSMTDDQLRVRYSKMKKREKMVAFHEALQQTNRNSYLRQCIAQDLGLSGRFDFCKVVKNKDDHKQAIFQYVGPTYHFKGDDGQERRGHIRDGETFMYSYAGATSLSPMGETMVFRCLPTGDIKSYSGVFQDSGYHPSQKVMSWTALTSGLWYPL